MSYKTKAATLADEIPHTPVAKRYACAAHGCPMPGTLFDGPGQAMGNCAYHWGANPTDWPRITQTLIDWACVTSEIGECRRALTNPATASNPGELVRLFAAAQARVEPLVGNWWAELKPQPGRGGAMDSYGSWAMRLERFIGARVQEQLTRRKAA